LAAATLITETIQQVLWVTAMHCMYYCLIVKTSQVLFTTFTHSV